MLLRARLVFLLLLGIGVPCVAATHIAPLETAHAAPGDAEPTKDQQLKELKSQIDNTSGALQDNLLSTLKRVYRAFPEGTRALILSALEDTSSTPAGRDRLLKALVDLNDRALYELLWEVRNKTWHRTTKQMRITMAALEQAHSIAVSAERKDLIFGDIVGEFGFGRADDAVTQLKAVCPPGKPESKKALLAALTNEKLSPYSRRHLLNNLTHWADNSWLPDLWKVRRAFVDESQKATWKAERASNLLDHAYLHIALVDLMDALAHKRVRPTTEEETSIEVDSAVQVVALGGGAKPQGTKLLQELSAEHSDLVRRSFVAELLREPTARTSTTVATQNWRRSELLFHLPALKDPKFYPALVTLHRSLTKRESDGERQSFLQDLRLQLNDLLLTAVPDSEKSKTRALLLDYLTDPRFDTWPRMILVFKIGETGDRAWLPSLRKLEKSLATEKAQGRNREEDVKKLRSYVADAIKNIEQPDRDK